MEWYAVERLAFVGRIEEAELDALDLAVLPDDDPYPKRDPGTYWWVVRQKPSLRIVAFAGSLYWKPDNCMFLCRCGVLPEARGKGLQRKLLRARVSHATLLGCDGCYTYTHPENIHSSNNLIRSGFELFDPENPWAGTDKLYWWRSCK